jgi:hypothetical protein
MSINLGNRNGVNLNLINPYQAPNTDRTYYFLDQNGNGNTNGDEVSHQALDDLFNGGADTTTSGNRTLTIDADGGKYTVKLPTVTELKPLSTSQNLFGGHWGGNGEFTYWAADRSDSPDQHALYGLRSTNTYYRNDSEGQFVALEVAFKSDTPLPSPPPVDFTKLQTTQISVISAAPISAISPASVSAVAPLDVSDLSLKTADGKAFTPKNVLAVIDEGDRTGIVTKTRTGWQEQFFGSDGIAERALVNMNAAQMLSRESSADKDINKDGRIGDYITGVFDSDGLYKTASGAISYSNIGLNVGDVISGEHDIQISDGKNWTTKNQIVAFVEHDGMGEILMKNKNKYSVQAFNTDTGLIEGGAKSVSASNVLAREWYYGADLNFDKSISNIGQNAMPTDWTQKNGSWF